MLPTAAARGISMRSDPHCESRMLGFRGERPGRQEAGAGAAGSGLRTQAVQCGRHVNVPVEGRDMN